MTASGTNRRNYFVTSAAAARNHAAVRSIFALCSYSHVLPGWYAVSGRWYTSTMPLLNFFCESPVGVPVVCLSSCVPPPMWDAAFLELDFGNFQDLETMQETMEVCRIGKTCTTIVIGGLSVPDIMVMLLCSMLHSRPFPLVPVAPLGVQMTFSVPKYVLWRIASSVFPSNMLTSTR